MTRELAIVFILFLSVITNSFRDFQDQMRSYHDTLYQRSWQHSSEESKDVNLRMPGVHPIKNDSYLCTAVNLGKRKQYIVGFKPFAEMHTAHHMLLFGCQVPADMAFSRDGKFWNCGDMGKGVCGNQGAGEKIIYAWGRNAPDLKLPKDVAFEVGGDSGIAYLVLQVHYGKVDQFVANPSLKDNSGVDLKTSFAPQKYVAGIKLLADGWSLIPPKKKGTVISGYRVRNGAFYPVKPDKEVDIKAGDTLPNQNNMETGIPESACLYVDEARLMFPLDSDVPLPGSGVKMEMKRDFAEGCGPYCNDDGPSLLLEEDKRSFDANEVFSNQKESIPEATVLTLDSKTGKIMNSWGQNMFFMPHGLTIDSEGNTWLTDVAMHQVFKFPTGRTESSLTLGVRFQPGSDVEHFCKPTDVAVDSSGFFYVSDG
ncbi:Peptidyl-glycine alpha-amidating monooxygenase [Acropora cervicornis]|uniref:Peptidyl-glycine alpha-amidating monooxygenase n=1 Tax=Acropora cervicornis TaxID=6130 RepID=A0AAD9QKH1_ACRCE|nr:Peptidyl-glycine alpha-amidating monooxygenase [Acropora cervicornis]